MSRLPLSAERFERLIEIAETVADYDNVGDYGYGGEVVDHYEIINWPEVIERVLSAALVDTGWAGHWTPVTPHGAPRFSRVHDKNSLHIDGCVPLFALEPSPWGTP